MVVGAGAVPELVVGAPVTELAEVDEEAGVVEPGVVGVVVRGEVAPVVLEGSVVFVVLSANAVVAVVSEVSARPGSCPGVAHVEDGHHGQAQRHQGGGGAQRQAAAAQSARGGGEGAPGLAGAHLRADRYPAAMAGGGGRVHPPQLFQLFHEGEEVLVTGGIRQLECLCREDLLALDGWCGGICLAGCAWVSDVLLPAGGKSYGASSLPGRPLPPPTPHCSRV